MWPTMLFDKLSRGMRKRRAKKLLFQLIVVDDRKWISTVRRQRYDAAIRLVELAETEGGGEEIVARRFLKTTSRQEAGARALLALSDDELDQTGFQLIDAISLGCASIKLLRIVMKYTNDANFFKKILSPALKSGNEGALAILHLAAHNPLSFFGNTDHKLVLNFSERVIGANELLSPRWYCGVKLLYNLFDRTPPDPWKESTVLPSILSNLFKGVIKQRQDSLDLGNGSFRDLSLFPLVMRCCNKLDSQFNSVVLPPPEILNPFVRLLIELIHSHHHHDLRRLHADRGWAFASFLPLLTFPTVVELIPSDRLPAFGELFMDMALQSWTLDIQETDPFEKGIIRSLKSKLDFWGIFALCCFPEPTFNNALSSALQCGMRELESPETNPYKPLSLVERLLWLSNLPIVETEVHRTLVNTGACTYLAHILSHTGNLDPEDRGLWRARGLAMTCLGNIVERMDQEQIRGRISNEMINTVVAIKEYGDVPLVQKGQAIFMLQRYTLAADRCGVQPYYREDVSSMADESGNADGSRSEVCSE